MPAILYTKASPRPDIGLLDWDMPGITGMETLRQLQRVSPSARVLIYSGHTKADYADAALAAGAMGYLRKPASETALREALAVALHRQVPKRIKPTLPRFSLDDEDTQ
jgi:DNA-binding NarL/FixJ family response regulator